MASNRNSGGINGRSGKNVNPIYRAMGTFNNYIKNISKEYLDVSNAERKYGSGSKEYNRQSSQLRGAVFQARRYED